MEKAKLPAFEGFPKELPAFLWDLALNNERPWFQAHKDTFERCLHQPLLALAEDVKARMNELFPGLAPALHVSRIYRDARRLYGRGPFNDHMWFSLGHSAEIYTPLPQFYFGVDAKCWEAGMGLWNMNSEQLERWRRSIDDRPREITKVVRALNKRSDLERYWQVYKRPKGDPGPELFDWYNARSVGLNKTVWFDPDPPGPELVDQILDVFKALTPLYRYLERI